MNGLPRLNKINNHRHDIKEATASLAGLAMTGLMITGLLVLVHTLGITLLPTQLPAQTCNTQTYGTGGVATYGSYNDCR